MEENEREYNDFIRKVDKIDEILKGLNSKDAAVQEEMTKKADAYLKKLAAENDLGNVKFNRTVINHEAFKNMTPGTPPSMPQSRMGPEMFMKEMERDAKEREEQKKIRERKAEILRKLGNEEFRKENYERALEYYDEALNQVRDNTILYTNRAQTFLRLERFDEAVKDCDWALRLFENCFKAYVIRGKAHMKINKFTEAIDDFEKAIFLEPQQKNTLQGFVDEAKNKKVKYDEEQKVLNLFNGGTENLKLLSRHLMNLQQQNKSLEFYSNETKALTKCFDEDSGKVFFRAQGGMELLLQHPEFLNLQKNGIEMTNEQLEFFSSVVEALTKACEANEYNCEELPRFQKLFDLLIAILENEELNTHKTLILQFFYILSMQPAGRIAIFSCSNSTRFLRALIHNYNVSSTVGSISASTLNNISLNESFRSAVKDRVEDTLIPTLQQVISESSNPAILKSFLTTLSNMSQELTIRKQLNDSKLLWDIIFQQLETASNALKARNNEDLIYASLGLLVNLTCERSPVYLQNNSEYCFEVLLKLLDEEQSRERAFIILGRLMASSDESLSQKSSFLLSKLLNIMKLGDQPLTKHAVRLLASIMKKNTEVKDKVAKTKSYFKILLNLLENKDEMTAGNAALCLSFCIHTTKNLNLITIDTFKTILKLIEEGSNADLKKNCGSLIANLAKLDARFAEYLQELNGFQILQDCIFKKHLL